MGPAPSRPRAPSAPAPQHRATSSRSRNGAVARADLSAPTAESPGPALERRPRLSHARLRKGYADDILSPGTAPTPSRSSIRPAETIGRGASEGLHLVITALRLTGVTNIAAALRHHARDPHRPLPPTRSRDDFAPALEGKRRQLDRRDVCPGGPTGQGPGPRPAGQIIHPRRGTPSMRTRGRVSVTSSTAFGSARLIRLNLGDGGTRRRRRQWSRPRLWTTPVNNGTGCPHFRLEINLDTFIQTDTRTLRTALLGCTP
jgi:hypothetical protein